MRKLTFYVCIATVLLSVTLGMHPTLAQTDNTITIDGQTYTFNENLNASSDTGGDGGSATPCADLPPSRWRDHPECYIIKTQGGWRLGDGTTAEPIDGGSLDDISQILDAVQQAKSMYDQVQGLFGGLDGGGGGDYSSDYSDYTDTYGSDYTDYYDYAPSDWVDEYNNLSGDSYNYDASADYLGTGTTDPYSDGASPSLYYEVPNSGGNYSSGSSNQTNTSGNDYSNYNGGESNDNYSGNDYVNNTGNNNSDDYYGGGSGGTSIPGSYGDGTNSYSGNNTSGNTYNDGSSANNYSNNSNGSTYTGNGSDGSSIPGSNYSNTQSNSVSNTSGGGYVSPGTGGALSSFSRSFATVMSPTQPSRNSIVVNGSYNTSGGQVTNQDGTSQTVNNQTTNQGSNTTNAAGYPYRVAVDATETNADGSPSSVDANYVDHYPGSSSDDPTQDGTARGLSWKDILWLILNLGNAPSGAANSIGVVSNIGSSIGGLANNGAAPALENVQDPFADTGNDQTAQAKPINDFSPAALNTDVQSDLTVTALRSDNSTANEYRFRGSLSRTLRNATDNLAFNEVGSYFGSTVEHKLLIDLGCDGSVDMTKTFTTPYYSILPRSDGADVLLSEYLKITENGLHCFAFDVDTNQQIAETDETNNRSNWRQFIAGFGAVASSTTSLLPPVSFEISAYTADGTLTQDWTSEDVVIGQGQQIAFRWDAPSYQSCLPLLSSLTPDVASNLSPVERNTLSERIDLHEHTGYYEIRCTLDGEIKKETIHVRVQ